MQFLGSANSIWKLACRYAISDGVPRRSLHVALIVGTVLNLINQGDALLGMASINWLKLVLTYCVPCVPCGMVGDPRSAPSQRFKELSCYRSASRRPAIGDFAYAGRRQGRLRSTWHPM